MTKTNVNRNRKMRRTRRVPSKNLKRLVSGTCGFMLGFGVMLPLAAMGSFIFAVVNNLDATMNVLGKVILFTLSMGLLGGLFLRKLVISASQE